MRNGKRENVTKEMKEKSIDREKGDTWEKESGDSRWTDEWRREGRKQGGRRVKGCG